MSTKQSSRAESEIRVENIGGIDESAVEFSPGVTVLVGRNATNRTSLLQAFMAALGSTDVSVKGNAEEAAVELTLDGETYDQQLVRGSNGVVADGDPYLDDPEVAELFAFLLESNEARRAVASGADLRDLIMRPVDTDAINAEIDRLQRERDEVDAELEELEDRKGDLPELERRREDLQEQVEEKEAELEKKEAELDSYDAEVEKTQAEKSELEEQLAELRSKRSDLEDVRYDIETERESLEALRAERRDLNEDLSELDDTPVGEIQEIDSRIERLRERKSTLETELNEVQSVIEFNEGMLEDGEVDLVSDDSDEDALTDQLLEDNEITCWTCGSTVDAARIESTVDRLRELSQSKFGEIEDVEEEIADLESERSQLQGIQRERERIERRLDDLNRKVESTEAELERLQDTRESLTEEVADIEEEVEALEEDVYSDLLETHREANQLEYELERLENDLSEVDEQIHAIEDRLEEEDALRERREEIQSEITAQRTKIERIEERAVEEFNESMDTVLDILDYDNIERIWIEPVEHEVREGRRKVTKRSFELHIVRTTAAGATYSDTVDHLSESEREVTGLIFSLAGYIAHDVADEMPVMLLDSLEAIDSQRIAALIEFLTDYTDYLVVAMLPEDSQALDDDHQRVTEI